MSADGCTGTQQCPAWCTGGEDLPDFPGDGFWHYGEPETITVTHGLEAH
jgi:hypothetical protein